MKKILLILSSALLLLAGCAKENLTPSNSEGELRTVSFTASVDNGSTTKAAADGDGAASNVNRCIMEVYYDNTLYTRMYAKVTDKKASFTTQMVSNRTYTVAFWADHVTDADTEAGIITDLYYNTASLKAVSVKDGYVGNNDERDAFFYNQDYTVTQNGDSFNATLTRPFAQVNVITTDLQVIKPVPALAPSGVDVTIKNAYTTLNLITGELGGETTLNYAASLYNFPAAIGDQTEATLSMDYLFAASTKEVIDIDWKATKADNADVAHAFAAVPYQRNYRTNIKGALLTATGQWNVEIDPNWDEPDYDQIVLVASSLAEAQSYVTNTADPVTKPITVVVTQEAADGATADDLMDVGGKTYIKFVLKTTSPKSVTFELPSAPGTVASTDVEGWLVTYEQGYPTEELNVQAPASTKVKILAPDSHVQVTGTTYAEVSAKTGENTLVIPVGVVVENLIIEKGGLEIHGTVNAVSITGTAATVFVRECEGLSESVYDSLEGFMAEGYHGVKVGDVWNIEKEDFWPNFAAKVFSNIDESAKTLTISTPEELALFAKTLNKQGSFAGYTVTISQDLDMSAHFWTPIHAYNQQGGGNISNATIQGPGVIKNLKIKTAVTPAASAASLTYGAGFIGLMDGNITFKDITFDHADVDVYNGSQVGVLVGIHYATATFDNVKVTNSTVYSCTKSGIILGQTDEKKAILKNCSVINSKIYASYSYALMVGLVNTNSSIELDGDNLSTGSSAVYDFSRNSDGEYTSKLTIKGFDFGVSGTDLWVCGVQNALAEQRISPIPQKTIGGTTYGIRGSKFYYNDKVVDVMEEAKPGTFNVGSVEELKDIINEINNTASLGQFTIELAEGTYDMEGVDILQKEGKQLTITAVTNADVTVSYPAAGTSGYIFKVKSSSSYKPNADIKFKDIKFSSKAASAFTTGAADERYVNDIDFINCEFTTSEGATPVTSPNNSQPSGLYFENCEVTNGSGYLYSGYGNNSSTARGYAVKAVGCTASNSKHFINVQNNGHVIVDNCTVSNYADYAIRTNGGNITVIDTDFICTDKTTTANGLLVVRQSNATVNVDTLSTFNKENAGTGIHDVQCGSDITITIAGRATGSISGEGTTYDFPNE